MNTQSRADQLATTMSDDGQMQTNGASADRKGERQETAPARAGAAQYGVTAPAHAQPHYRLADELLRGAEEIAEFLFGDRRQRRKVYHLAETSRIPIFRLGSMLCARPTVLMRWIGEQEQRGWNLKGSSPKHDRRAEATPPDADEPKDKEGSQSRLSSSEKPGTDRT